jgi:hypothetical protein
MLDLPRPPPRARRRSRCKVNKDITPSMSEAYSVRVKEEEIISAKQFESWMFLSFFESWIFIVLFSLSGPGTINISRYS